MNNKVTLHLPRSSAQPEPGPAPSRRLPLVLLALAMLGGIGCYRAAGLQRNPIVAEVLPETGGDKVYGLKLKGGTGSLYLGNDFIQVAIDSAAYGDPVQVPIAGAASGGSIIDAGYLELNNSYTRVSVPGNAMNRLTPVVNQDPDLQMVFDTFVPLNTGGVSSITMTGGILDAKGKLGPAGRVPGVSVTHTLSIQLLNRYIAMTTTVTNTSGASLPILNIGDFLTQQGGGYAFNIPAKFDASGTALQAQPGPPYGGPWGVQIPGTDFSNPLANSVQSPMVGLMDTEPGADTLDSHCTLGLLPADADLMLVAADAQDLLDVPNNLRPSFPARLVAGSLPAGGNLASGGSLTYNRRLFIVGGQSVAINIVGGLTLPANYPDQATGLFNLLDTYRYSDTTLRPPQDFGTLTFTLGGMSQRQGPLPTQIRIERDVNAETPPAVSSGDNWQLQRVEWFEPNENLVTNTTLAPSTLSVRLPLGIYRMILTSRGPGVTYTQTRTLFQNINAVASPSGQNQGGIEGPIWIQKDQEFLVSPQDILCPVAAPDVVGGMPDVAPTPPPPAGNPNAVGVIASNPYSLQYISTREANSSLGSLQPLRIVFKGTGTTADPVMRRMRSLATYYDQLNGQPEPAPRNGPGQYQFRGGNEMFGTGFTQYLPCQFVWLPNGGSYTAYGTRGPLSDLQTLNLQAFDGQTDTSHMFTISPLGLPPNWTSFDLPAPGQATTGGYLPGEKLASAMANGVQVVGHTERDIQVDAPTLQAYFKFEFYNSGLDGNLLPASLSAMNRPANMPYGQDPFVLGGRTTTLAGYGEATALFTPVASNAPLGGVLPNTGWNLADFLAQGQGQFTVMHRPRAPQGNAQGDPVGLFNQQGAPAGIPNSGTVLDPVFGAAWQTWWTTFSQGSGPNAVGRVNGNLDALELLRGANLALSTPSAWFSEFLTVRNDWFALLNLQGPAFFTKGLGLSSANFSVDTPVGLARTYLKANPVVETDLSGVQAALQSGAAVASTGPFLDVSVGSAGPGQLVPGPVQNVTLNINLWRTDWMPVDELRVIVNGNVVQTIPVDELPAPAVPPLAQSGADPRLFSGSFPLTLPAGVNAWIVVEAGVPLAGPSASELTQPIWTTWNANMRGIYPIAVTNPIFVNVLGGGYTPVL